MKNTPWKVFEKIYPTLPGGFDQGTTIDIRGCDDWCVIANLPNRKIADDLVREINERPYMVDLLKRMAECFEGCYYTAKLPAADAFNLIAEAKDMIRRAEEGETK